MSLDIPPEEKFKILTKYFLGAFPLDLLIGKQPPGGWREERAYFYFDKLTELHRAIEKIERYEAYFSEFYPDPTKISEAEAIEYHWHSYIHDFYILEDRVKKIIGSLKNDLPRYGIANADEIKEGLEHFKQQIVKNLEEAHEIRKTLSHDSTVRDFNLTKAKTLKFLKEMSKELSLNESEIDKKYNALVQKSKKEYIDMAVNNKKGMAELRNFFAPRFGYIFASLNEHDTSVFEM